MGTNSLLGLLISHLSRFCTGAASLRPYDASNIPSSPGHSRLLGAVATSG